MSRRTAICLVVGLLYAVTNTGPAQAATGITNQAWVRTRPIVTFVPEASSLYVATTARMEEARAFVQLDIGDVAAASRSEAELRLHEASDTLRPEDAELLACITLEPVRADGEISDPVDTDCATKAVASRSADGTWTVPLAPFLKSATGGRFGLALSPGDSTPAATWRLSFAVSRTQLVTNAPPTPTTDAGQSDTVANPPSENVVAPPLVTWEPPAIVDPTPVTPATTVPNATAPTPNRTLPIGDGMNTRAAVVAMFAVVALCLTVVVATPLRRRVQFPARQMPSVSVPRPALIIAIVIVSFAPLLAREVIVYKAGVVIIFFIGAIGLHVLVNWAGQLSLAHSATVGLPAFVVLALSDVHDLSPLYLVPLAIVVGAAVGTVIALPTLRARDLQVSLVTLVAGIAIARFFFSQSWLVGQAGGRSAAAPRLGPLELTTSRSLYPLLIAVAAFAVTVAWLLMHSRFGRAWFWTRTHPQAAAAYGISVNRYRLAAYAVGGAFGGLAGGMLAAWVQRMGPDAFPPSLSFSYMVVAVMAGPGFVGGVAVATFVLQGGQQFSGHIFGSEVGETVEAVLTYGGALALIDMIARHPSGLNGLGGKLMKRIRSGSSSEERRLSAEREPEPVTLMLIAGVTAIVAGFVAITLAWRHSSQTAQLWVQNQEILSGGIGGLGLIVVGACVIICDRLRRNNAALIGAFFETADRSAEQPIIEPALELEAASSVTTNGADNRRRRPLRPVAVPASPGPVTGSAQE